VRTIQLPQALASHAVRGTASTCGGKAWFNSKEGS
jgi:hypothetical protein